ncbi:MAG: DUF3365 domain-containing protein [Rhodomicrobium sp.]
MRSDTGKALTKAAVSMTALLSLSFHASAEQNLGPEDVLAAQARGITAQFAEKLKSQLTGAMKAEGPVKAIEVCKVAAPAIAGEVSTEGWTVGRTSLKLRNSKSKPDAWEKQTLESFEAEKAKGADPNKLERSEIVSVNGVRVFRYMKAIPTAELCLTCHGSDLKASVKAKLAELYPDDQATGFKLGDIRGAFTLSKPVQ